MSQIKPILPEGWPRAAGYSYGVIADTGTSVHVAGQLPVDPETGTCINGDFVSQWGQALANVVAVVVAAGCSRENIVSMRIYVRDMDSYRNASGEDLGKAWMQHIGKWFPAITMVEVAGLENAEAQIEIEAEARK